MEPAPGLGGLFGGRRGAGNMQCCWPLAMNEWSKLEEEEKNPSENVTTITTENPQLEPGGKLRL